MDNIITAESWLHLQELLFEDAWDDAIQRHRSRYVFRGGSVFDHALITSLNRICSGNEHLEQSLLRNFRKYSADNFSPNTNFWRLVSLAQHHGLPTRMLDWTFSPYVALHFATAKLAEYDQDGIVWCVDVSKANQLLPKRLRTALAETDALTFTTDILSGTIDQFKDMIHHGDQDYVMFYEPPSISGRIANQYALFSVFSNPKIILSDWLQQHPHIYKKILLPSHLKWEVRDKLDQCNITERTLFPGLDGLCKWLSRHYTSNKCDVPPSQVP